MLIWKLLYNNRTCDQLIRNWGPSVSHSSASLADIQRWYDTLLILQIQTWTWCLSKKFCLWSTREKNSRVNKQIALDLCAGQLICNTPAMRQCLIATGDIWWQVIPPWMVKAPAGFRLFVSQIFSFSSKLLDVNIPVSKGYHCTFWMPYLCACVEPLQNNATTWSTSSSIRALNGEYELHHQRNVN